MNVTYPSKRHSRPLSGGKDYTRGRALSGYERLPTIGRVSTLVGRFEKNEENSRNELQRFKRRSLSQTQRVRGSVRNSVPQYQMYTNSTLLANWPFFIHTKRANLSRRLFAANHTDSSIIIWFEVLLEGRTDSTDLQTNAKHGSFLIGASKNALWVTGWCDLQFPHCKSH